MTAYTSFVAVDESIRNTEGKSRTQVQPLPLPKGVEETAVHRRVLSGTVASRRSYGGGVLDAKGSGFGGGSVDSILRRQDVPQRTAHRACLSYAPRRGRNGAEGR